MSWTLIESDAALADALAALPATGPVAVDTEFMRRNTYFPQVALLQLCAGDGALLIDPLAVTDLEPIRALLRDPARPKVLHSCSEDLEVFRCWLGEQPTPLIDTQRAAALVGEPHGLGYQAIVERLLGVALEKGETRSDWLRRPLTDSQCHYAAQDVLHLLPVWEQLEARARRLGRLDWIVEEGQEAIAALEARDRDLYRRVKGAGRLAPRQLAVLAALCDWRESRARRLDKPRGWILDDKACVAIARSLPTQRQTLAELEVLPPSVLRREGDALLALVEAALVLPETSLPAAQPEPLTPAQRSALKTLKERSRALAESLGIAPESALSGAELELLLREAAGERVVAPPRWGGWRAAAVIQPLREALA